MRVLGEPIKKTVAGKCLNCGGKATYVDFHRSRPYWVCKECSYSWGVWEGGLHVWHKADGYNPLDSDKEGDILIGGWQKIDDGVLLSAGEKKL